MAYLVHTVGAVKLVMDLRLTHECWGSNSNPVLNDNLHFPHPTDIDNLKTLNEADTDKIREYRPDHKNRPSHSVTFIGFWIGFSPRLVQPRRGSFDSYD